MFEWNPEYSIKLPGIDAQHERLFALAGALHAALIEGKGYPVLEQSLSSLVDHTRIHFVTEEELMMQYAYPQAGEHKAEHDKLTSQLLELQRRLRNGENSLSLDLLMFLKNWLEHHIAGSDRRYSVYLRGKQAEAIRVPPTDSAQVRRSDGYV